MWEQSECQNNLTVRKRSKSLEECTFQSKEQNSLKNVLSFNILSGLCGRQINRDTDPEESKNYLEILPASSSSKDVDSSSNRFPTNVHLKYVRKGQFLSKSNISTAANYRNSQSEFRSVHRSSQTPTLTEFRIDKNYQNFRIYLNKEEQGKQLENRRHKLTKASQSDHREYASRRYHLSLTLQNQSQIRTNAITKWIWPRNISWPSPLEINLFCLTTPSVLIDAITRQNSYESAINLECTEDVDQDSDRCINLPLEKSYTARRQLNRQASIQSQSSSFDDSSTQSDRYGTAFESLEDIPCHDIENTLSQGYQSILHALPASSVHLVMSLSSYRSQQAHQPLNNSDSQKNLECVSQLPTPLSRATSLCSMLQLGCNLNSIDVNESQQYKCNDEVVAKESATVATVNDNQSVIGVNCGNNNNNTHNSKKTSLDHFDNNIQLNNNMVGTQQQTKNNSQLSTTNAIRDASTFTGDLDASAIDIQIGKPVSPAMLTMNMSQSQPATGGVGGSASIQMNPSSLSHHSCTALPFNFNSGYGSTVTFQDRKQHTKQAPIQKEQLCNYIADSSGLDACGVSKSIQGMRIAFSTIFETHIYIPISKKKKKKKNAIKYIRDFLL